MIRDLIKSISPSWAQDGEFERYLYGCGLAIDAVIEKLTQGMHAHMPLKADPSALPRIGEDRLMPKGLSEADASYATRLQHAFDDWRIAGNPWSLLRQTLGALLSATPAARLVSSQYIAYYGVLSSSIWNSYAAGDDTSKPPARQNLDVNFDWDSDSPSNGSWGWWRTWLILYAVAPNDWCGPAPFAFGTSGVKFGLRPDASIGLNVAPSVVSGVRAIAGLWKAQHSWVHEIIISFDAALFDPAHPTGGGINPDGLFGRWSKVVGGAYVPSRFSNARYCTGVL